LVWAISLPMAGQWSDRVGRRRSFLVGALITAFGLALTAIAQDIFQLILIRSVTAIGYGIVYIAAQSYVADHTTARDRTKGMATFLGGFFSGSLSGAALGGILADRIGYQGTFGVAALMSLMAAMFVYYFISQRPTPIAREVVVAPQTRLRVADFWQLFRDRCFAPITLLTAIPAKILLTGFLYYSAPLYLRSAGASQSATGRVIMLYGLSIVLLGPLAAWMADRWHLRRSFIGLGALCSAAALCIPILSPGAGGLLAAIALVGIAHAVAVAPQLAVITEHMQTRPNPPSMGKVIGIFRLSERAGNILGPMVFGVLLNVARPETTFMHVGVYVAISALLFFLVLGGCQRRGAA
jgi:predicted MFS family arabinose efflux permease